MDENKGKASDPALLAEVVAELERAELVIQTMLGFMDTEQKARMAAALKAAGKR